MYIAAQYFLFLRKHPLDEFHWMEGWIHRGQINICRPIFFLDIFLVLCRMRYQLPASHLSSVFVLQMN